MADFPPGLRFYPTEQELVSFYLHNKLRGSRPELNRVIPVVDMYNIEPWDLPNFAGERCQGDTEQWFFFTKRQERESRGGRPNRTTSSGYWKATGSPGYVYSSENRIIGVQKTMVFYKGRAPTGRKTKWKMKEYRAIDEVIDPSNNTIPQLRHEFSLCRVYVISGNFRAFDRRPSEPQRNHGEIAASSRRSPKNSDGGGDGGDTHRNSGGERNLEMDNDVEETLWEWEGQLDWL